MNVQSAHAATYRTRRAAKVARVTFQPQTIRMAQWLRTTKDTAHLPIGFRTGGRPLNLPAGITTTRTFDDPTVAPEAHDMMNARFNTDRAFDQYEG